MANQTQINDYFSSQNNTAEDNSDENVFVQAMKKRRNEIEQSKNIGEKSGVCSDCEKKVGKISLLVLFL